MSVCDRRPRNLPASHDPDEQLKPPSDQLGKAAEGGSLFLLSGAGRSPDAKDAKPDAKLDAKDAKNARQDAKDAMDAIPLANYLSPSG